MQDMLMRKVKGGLMGMRQGTKTPEEVFKLLKMLKNINEGVYQELLNDYMETVKQLKK